MEALPLHGVPEGLRAQAKRQLRTDADGQRVEIRDRRGHLKLTQVYLSAAGPAHEFSPNERELTFLLGADRRAWATIERRFGAHGFERAMTFARAGAVIVECAVDGLAVGRPVGWQLSGE